MCGRFTLRADGDALRAHFRLPAAPAGLAARYNIAPSQVIPVVRWDPVAGRPELVMQRWGLVPAWMRKKNARESPAPAPQPDIAAPERRRAALTSGLINARAESLTEKPAFRDAFRHRRCLIPADGFYEWTPAPGGGKQPWFIHQAGDRLFALAGLWEPGAGPDPETCTIVTRPPLPELAAIHDRMPAILAESDYDGWLGAESRDRDALLAILARAAPAGLESFPVSRAVNSAAADSPACLQPAP